MPDLNADGDVIDIALHTVKVQNWDKTITTIPTYRLISESYKNWRGMAESGARRVMRSLHMDQNSVAFLTEEDKSALRRSEEHTSELQSLMRISYAVFCLKKKNKPNTHRKDH